MTDLLDLAIEAHGGWTRWEKINQLSVGYTATGITDLKGWQGVFLDVRVTVDAHHQRSEIAPFVESNQLGIFEPTHTRVISQETGGIIDERFAPRKGFSGHGLTTPWDRQNLLYFAGYALWTYLTTPFLFKMEGFRSKEIEPWEEDGQLWRRLKVTFPAVIESHSTEQIFYFDETGILQRHDYSADVLGGTSSANYATDPKVFDGIVIPTKRRVYAKGSDNRPILDRVAVSIDIHDVSVK